MMKVVFKNMSKSELALEAVEERMACVFEKFPDLNGAKVVTTLKMENSPLQAGPDVFIVHFHCTSGRYRGIILERSAQSLYLALADLVDGLLERLNRFGDKIRVKSIKESRAISAS